MSLNGDGRRDEPPAPAAGLEPPRAANVPHGNVAKRLKAPAFVFMGLGVGILGLLLFIPLWNASKMLHDPIFEYFVGKAIPNSIITVASLTVILYLVVIGLFFRYSEKTAQSEQNMLMIGNVFILTLGSAVLLLSLPLRGRAELFETQIVERCELGAGTRGLYTTYHELIAVRRTPSCVAQVSVEDCEGFRPSPNAVLLKEMEWKYKCSGWGSPPALGRAHVSRAEESSTSLLQVEVRLQDAHGVESVPVNQPNRSGSRAAAFRASQPPGEQEAVSPYIFPPTLFSNSNFRASCDGMTALDLQYFLLDTANGLHYQGIYLVLISIGIGFLKLIGFCIKDSMFLQVPIGYGTNSLDKLEANPELRQRRYVSQGLLH